MTSGRIQRIYIQLAILNTASAPTFFSGHVRRSSWHGSSSNRREGITSGRIASTAEVLTKVPHTRERAPAIPRFTSSASLILLATPRPPRYQKIRRGALSHPLALNRIRPRCDVDPRRSGGKEDNKARHLDPKEYKATGNGVKRNVCRWKMWCL